jgi:ATP-dependent helicase HrpB
MPDSLPIDAVLPDLIAALGAAGQAVLVAPPGAGKTTRVPLALLESGGIAGRILMLEPRRIAARMSAQRMAETLGEAPGATVGYRMRGEAAVGRATRIEVLTEGILARMMQDDPSLDGVGAVIFDEFHERSLAADLGLALALEVRGALRPDLRLLVMSATLDPVPVAELMGGAPVIVAGGRAFPVETRWLPRPLPAGRSPIDEMAALLPDIVAETEGAILAFLPGEGEIRRVARALAGRLPAGVEVAALYGALPLAEQRRVLAPDPAVRRVVLATAIAETSLTIPDVRVVVDAGLARRSRFDPARGMARLVTERASRAEADQRRGRAGRTGPGICHRLWAAAEEGAMPAFAPPEIAVADLAPLALDLARWGGGAGLRFLTPPPEAGLAAARALLQRLGALDSGGRITEHGAAMAALPVHPRLAHMGLRAGRAAAPLAALLAERDPLRGAPPDLAPRLAALAGGPAPHPPDRDTLARIRAEVGRLAPLLPARPAPSPGAMAAIAYPDRIGMRRPGEPPRWILSGGGAATMPADAPLATAPYLVATDIEPGQPLGRIRQAAALTEAELRETCAGAITRADVCAWSAREGRILARRQERLGALVLTEAPWPDPPAEALAGAALEGVRAEGLTLNDAARRLCARAEGARALGADLPPMDEATLLTEVADWLLPWLGGVRSRADLAGLDLIPALRARLGAGAAMLDAAWPAHYETPLGRRVPIDYDAETPTVTLRLQEVFGETRHPVAGPARTPLRLVLLSPGNRPVAVTTDLPGFWASGYREVRRDMRGRYPRHPWPEDPTTADPTTRAKPRGT